MDRLDKTILLVFKIIFGFFLITLTGLGMGEGGFNVNPDILTWLWIFYALCLILGDFALIFILIPLLPFILVLLLFFPEISRHNLGWPLTFGYVRRKIFPFDRRKNRQKKMKLL